MRSAESTSSSSDGFRAGFRFKKDLDDCRNSPALKVMELLGVRGVRVSFHDPYVSEVGVNGQRRRSVPLTDDVVREADCVLILTDHSCVAYDRVVANARLVVDVRNATSGIDAPQIVRM